MRPKSLILLLLALGCGLVASIGISQVIEHRNRDAGPAAETEKILVALKNIKVNEPLTPQNLKLEDWPKEKIPSDAIRDLLEFEGQRAGSTILAGEPLRKAKFAVDKRIDEIPSGYRVVALPADAVSATGYLLQPGDRVDVLVYFNRNAMSGVQQTGVKTILQDVRVFAVNEQWRPSENKSDESIPAKTVSLLVTKEQAQIATLADAMGKIRLVLRNPDDDQVAETPSTDISDLLLGGDRGNRGKEWAGSSKGGKSGLLNWLTNQAPPAQAAPQPEPEEHFTMELLEGEELSRIDFTRKSKDGRWKNNSGGSDTGNGPGTVNPGAPAPPLDTSGSLPASDNKPLPADVPFIPNATGEAG